MPHALPHPALAALYEVSLRRAKHEGYVNSRTEVLCRLCGRIALTIHASTDIC